MAHKDDCIRAAMKAGATRNEAEGIVDAIHHEAKLARAEGKVANVEREVASRMMQRFDAERVQKARERKQAALTIRRRAESEADIASMMQSGASFTDAMTASLVGSEGRFPGSRDSVGKNLAGIRGEWEGAINNELAAIDGAIPLLRKDRSFSVAVHREMLHPDSTGDARARAVASVFTRYLEDGRTRCNDAGANIGKIENYAPQNHAEERMLRWGEGEVVWADFIDDLIDWEKSFPDVDASDIHARKAVLSEVFSDIITGRGRKQGAREAGQYTMPRNLASGLARERVLHFKDADAALAYHDKYGRGTIVDIVFSQLDRMSSRIALMERYGPNPEIMIKSLIDREGRRVRTATQDEIRQLVQGRAAKNLKLTEKRIEAARKAGDEAAEKQAVAEWETGIAKARGALVKEASQLWPDSYKGTIGKYFAVLSGEVGTPVNITAARISSNIRITQGMSKLGKVLLSSISDVPVKAMSLRHNGMSLPDMFWNAIKINIEGRQSAETKALGRKLGVYTQHLTGSVLSRFDTPDAPSGFMTRQMNTFIRLTGLEAWTEGHKAAYTMTLSHMLADAAGKGFDGVNVDFAVTLRRYGLEKKWPLIQKMVSKEADGNTHILPERIYDLSDADLEGFLPERYRQDRMPTDAAKKETWEYARLRELDRVRRETATDIMGFYADETRYAVLEPDEKTRAFMTQGTRPGTPIGELLRFVGQFKGFPMAYTQRVLLGRRWQRASNDASAFSDFLPGAIPFAVASIATGYVALMARDLSSGKELRSLAKPETYFAAAMQGGGLGILGDFFLAKNSRTGDDFITNLAGPTLGLAGQFVNMGTMAVRGEMQDVGDEMIRVGMSNIPYINLFYTRAALDYMALFHVREFLSPGTLARTERKLEKEFNQSYLKTDSFDLTPSKHIKRGGGFK